MTCQIKHCEREGSVVESLTMSGGTNKTWVSICRVHGQDLEAQIVKPGTRLKSGEVLGEEYSAGRL